MQLYVRYGVNPPDERAASYALLACAYHLESDSGSRLGCAESGMAEPTEDVLVADLSSSGFHNHQILGEF